MATCTTVAGALSVVGVPGLSVSTASEEARSLCRQGIGWLWSFHHEEAVRCFEAALAAAEAEAAACPLAAWGAAHCCSSDYNEGVYMDEAKASAHIATAVAQLPQASALEVALIRAEKERIDAVDGGDAAAPQVYARAMKRVHEQHPHSAEVAAVFAHAVMMQRACAFRARYIRWPASVHSLAMLRRWPPGLHASAQSCAAGPTATAPLG